jgi:hypothetical protein
VRWLFGGVLLQKSQTHCLVMQDCLRQPVAQQPYPPQLLLLCCQPQLQFIGTFAYQLYIAHTLQGLFAESALTVWHAAAAWLARHTASLNAWLAVQHT